MKKTISILVLSMISFTINAQVAKDFKMKQMDKSVPLQTTTRKPLFTVDAEPATSSVYTSQPRKIITLSGGRTISAEMVRNGNVSTGDAAAVQKITTQNLPTEKNNGWTTEVKKVYLKSESTSFMNASNTNSVNIVPGAIYAYEDFIGGNYNEIFANRTPIRIYTANALTPGSTGGVVVNNPSAYDILHSNGGNNIDIIKNSIVQSMSGIQTINRSFTSNTEAELNLKVTGGGSYAGFSANGSYKLTQSNNKFYITIDAIKPMFTIKAERPVNGFFTSANTVLNKIYIQEVTYGTRVLANVEVILKKREDIINFESSYSGAFNANLGSDFAKKESLNTETINAYLVGVPVGTSGILHKDKLKEDIDALLTQCTFQSAMPVYYKLADMDGNTIATRSVTDEIIERNSVPDDLVYHLQEASLTINTGNDAKEWQSRVAMELYSGNDDNGAILMSQPIDNSKIDFPADKPMTFGLSVNPGTTPDQLEMNNIKNAGGLRLRIYYYANWGTDAWKIEDENLKLTFVDQNGIPYPSASGQNKLDGTGYGITCINASAILDGLDRKAMECYFNKDFRSTGIAIKK